MLALIVLSLVVIGVTTILYFNNQNEVYHQDRLQRKEKTVLMSLGYFFKDAENEDEINGVSKVFEDEITKLADINGVEVNIFSMAGEILMSSDYDYADPDFYKTTVDADILTKLWSTQKRQVVDLDSENVSTYSLIYGKDGNTPIAIVNIPYNTTSVNHSSGVAPFLTTLIEIYIFLLIGASLVAFFLSNYITKGLRSIGEKLKEVQIHKKNEPIIWKGNDEIGALVVEYNRMIAQLENSANKLAKSERESAWREMAKQVAHEIKNPLTPMKLSIQHLQRALHPDDPDFEDKMQRFADKLITQIDALTNIANEFSNFAKMPKSNMEPVDIKEILLKTIDLFAEHENLVIKLETNGLTALPSTGDREQLTRVFNNIIKNALQAIPSDREGLITVDLQKESNKYVITITDNGDGIPEEIIDKIFVPNFTTKTSGSGLGLAMVKQIITAHDGDISFTTEEGKGTQFVVELLVG
jgi:nitrogen fixation/metabolism regulation signal transduction histidine kinase